jgi:glycosyltransferase involved in cell wall biosynthesis
VQVVLVSPPWYPVPPHGYGGVELVVGLLAGGLRRQGHTVHVLTAAGSTDPGAVTLAPRECGRHLGLDDERWFDLAYSRAALDWVRRHSAEAVVHDHSGGIVLAALSGLSPEVPVIHTVHGPLGAAQRHFYGGVGPEPRLVAISHAQALSAPELPWCGVVHNAVDVDSLMVGRPVSRERYLLVLARICPEKGQHLAIEIARRSGMRLVLAGKVEATAASNRYYQSEIAPHLDGSRVVHLANVAGTEKAELLARAWALLAPLQWEEPFGLSMVEAMASGTPVLALRRGAAPELIEHGVTGFLADRADELADLVGSCPDLDPDRIAARTRARFSPDRMAADYASLYRELLEAGSGRPSLPKPGRVRLDDLGTYTRDPAGDLSRAVAAAPNGDGELARAEPDPLDGELLTPGRQPGVQVDAPGGQVGVQPQDGAHGVKDAP